MSSDIVIKVENLNKCFQVYDLPRNRLKQFVLPRLQQALGQPPKQYYKEFWALKDINFEVKRGESVGIIGRNGAGKSTLLQIITGVLAPTLGSVEVVGRVAALLELGSGFNPEFTGKENVYMNASILGLTQAEINKKYQGIVDFADIGDFIDQPVKTYSSGMMMRLAFAVQSSVDPEVLIVDEALGVGDASFQKKCSDRLQKLKNKGVTLLFVSHDVFSVRQLCEKALFLDKGETISYGDSGRVTRDYYSYLFPVAEEAVSSESEAVFLPTTEMPAAILREKKHLPGVSRVPIPERLSWGVGGIKLNSMLIHGNSVPGGFREGDILVFKMEFTCQAEQLHRLAEEHGVEPRIFFGVRIDTDKSLVLCDLVEHPTIEKNIEDVISVTFSMTMPALQPANYFFTPDVAMGRDELITPLASYDNLIILRSEPSSRFIGLIDINYTAVRN